VNSSRRRRPVAGGTGLAVGVVVVLAGCGSQHPGQRGASEIAAAAAIPAPVPHAAPITAVPAPSSTAPPDATGQYAPAQPPAAAAQPAGTAAAAVAGVDYRDPLAVARAYVSLRWTYRWTDPAGYATALSAPQLSTAAFAARSTPGAAALAQLRTAQEISKATVLSAGYSREAPNTAITGYVTTQFAVTATYRGAGSGRTEHHIWSLRLADTADGWRVDGVVAAD